MNLLVAIDFSEHTATILDQAVSIARPMEAKVWLLHVAEPEPDFVGYDVGPQNERDARAEKFHREHTEIQALSDQLRSDGLDATALLVQGSTAATILHEADKLKADMIIMGSHGRGAMRQLLVGSSSEGVVKGAKCPVLIIPTREVS